MINANALLKIAKVIDLPSDHPLFKQSKLVSSSYTLKWRQKILWVKRVEISTSVLPTFKSQEWLIECLKYSPVQLVCLDSQLGELEIYQWAEVCKQAGKKAILRVPANKRFAQKPLSLGGWLKQGIAQIVAALMLLVLSPLLLSLVLLVGVTTPRPIFSWQWQVGKRGQLFQTIKFNFGTLMGKLILDELTKLINIVRGEISLARPCSWTLNEILDFTPSAKPDLNLSMREKAKC